MWNLVCPSGAMRLVGRGLSILTLFLACILLSLGCGSSTESAAAAAGAGATAESAEPEEEAIAVKVSQVRLEPLSSIYATSATLRADKQATVTARTRGVIRQLLGEEGDVVASGAALAILENDEQTIEYERASSNSTTAQREHERARRLHEQGLMSEEDYEKTRRDAEQARHTAALAELILERTVVRAPFSGMLLIRHLDVGATVNDGTSVYDLADLSPLYADVNVPERQIPRLQRNQAVRVFDGSSELPSDARIERIAPVVETSTGTVKVTLAVKPGGGLRPGSFVRVEIVTETHGEALVVPRSALVAEGRRWHLYRVIDGERVEQLSVQRGFEEGDRVEILSVEESDRPLRSGDQVVTVGASALSDDVKVSVVKDTDVPA